MEIDICRKQTAGLLDSQTRIRDATKQKDPSDHRGGSKKDLLLHLYSIM